MRVLKRVAFWLAMIVFSPVFSFLYLFGSMIGMQVAFISKFRIENRTTRSLWVTPVGTAKSRGFFKFVLLQFATEYPALRALRSRDLPVEPGGSIRVLYDWDTANFSDIVVRNAEGEYRQRVVDPDPPKGNSYPSRQESYAIEDWESLPPAAADVIAAAREPDRVLGEYGLFLAGLVFMGLYIWLWSVYESPH